MASLAHAITIHLQLPGSDHQGLAHNTPSESPGLASGHRHLMQMMMKRLMVLENQYKSQPKDPNGIPYVKSTVSPS